MALFHRRFQPLSSICNWFPVNETWAGGIEWRRDANGGGALGAAARMTGGDDGETTFPGIHPFILIRRSWKPKALQKVNRVWSAPE